MGTRRLAAPYLPSDRRRGVNGVLRQSLPPVRERRIVPFVVARACKVAMIETEKCNLMEAGVEYVASEPDGAMRFRKRK
jgi:hypothetical protein